LASVIVDRTHAVRRSGMQAASAAISLVGFGLDLMWHKDLTRMRWRNVARSGGASSGLAGGRSWESRCGSTAVARSAAAWERESDGGRVEEDEGNEVNPAPAHYIYRGVHRNYLLRLLGPYNTPQRLYPEKFA
jgi:hypothetical protein